MTPVLAALAALVDVMRTVLLAGGIVLALVAALDWAVRTRRVSPFSGVARFMRLHVDPRLAGLERTVTRAGGNPASTPMWALVAYVVAGALLLAVLGMLAGAIAEAAYAASLGAIGILVLAVRWTFAFVRIALFVRVLSSWFPALQRSAWTRWAHPATDWLLRPLRRLVPTFGMVDVTPIVAYFALQLAQWLVESILFSALRG